MRSLVTGCAGFIGSHLTESLLDSGETVVGVDCFNDNYGRREKLRNLERALDWDGFEFVPIDLARGELFDLVADCDRVFHLAAEPGVRPSWGSRFENYLRNNVQATQHLLEAVRATSNARFIYASSSSVYGQIESFPTPESAIPQPFSPYGVTKLSAEHLCDLYHGNYGLETVSLRLFSVYGPRQRPDMAFNIFSFAALAGAPITVFGDGRQTRDFTYVGDVVTAMRKAAGTPAAIGKAINVGGGSRVSLMDAIEVLGDLNGAALDVQHQERQAGDVRDTCADTRLAQHVLGFRPQTSLSEGLAEELEWVRSVAPDSARGRLR